MDSLYQQIVLQHNRQPRHYGAPEHCDCQARGYNPVCGDDLQVYVQLDKRQIQALFFAGQSCAIATAAASMMTGVMEGIELDLAGQLIEQWLAAVEQGAPLQSAALRTMQPLLSVRAFPGRHGCATLAWKALRQCLQQMTGDDQASLMQSQ
ncbi:MAG: SUF system NifU family Fe-S cluster assembly protein [Wenzhouxiangellaceae bacterium]